MVLDYSKGVIYVIKNTVNKEIYVGSTTRSLRARFIEHIHDACRNRAGREHNKFHLFMKAIGFEHFYPELYENYPCQSRLELCMREKSVIRDVGTLNTFHNVDNGYVKVTPTHVSHVHNQPFARIQTVQTASNVDLPLLDAMYPKNNPGRQVSAERVHCYQVLKNTQCIHLAHSNWSSNTAQVLQKLRKEIIKPQRIARPFYIILFRIHSKRTWLIPTGRRKHTWKVLIGPDTAQVLKK